jgi:cytochrome oxidase Cu insertion factor (SCO1/SenC/PrrC family)
VSDNATPLQGRTQRFGGRPLVVSVALLLGAVVGTTLAVFLHSSQTPTIASAPNAVWSSGSRPAPSFTLRDQNDRPVSLRSFRRRPVILTFIDPVCRSLCPLEAQQLSQVVRDLGPKQAPALLAVSVNPSADTPANFSEDARAWRLPSTWRWATGPSHKLARVWRSYAIAVGKTRVTLAGVTVDEVVHTEAAYLVDGNGYERALYLYPFHAADLERELRALGRN